MAEYNGMSTGKLSLQLCIYWQCKVVLKLHLENVDCMRQQGGCQCSLQLLIRHCASGTHYKDSFIGPQEFVVGYSKVPEQPQSSARPICHSHTMATTGRQPATICIATYRSLPCYALRHGRRLYCWIVRSNVECKVCPTLLHMTGTRNWTPDLLTFSLSPCSVSHTYPEASRCFVLNLRYSIWSKQYC